MVRRFFRISIRLALLQVMLLGVAFLARRLVSEWGDEDSDEFQLAAIIGGREFRSRARALRGGTVIAAYGGVELDLREAHVAPGGAALRCVTILGGVAILVPDGWRVRLRTTAILGGAEKRTTPDDQLPPDAPELTIDATAVCGGVAVRAKAPVTAAA